MEKRITKKTREFFKNFKDDIKQQILQLSNYKKNEQSMKSLLQYIYDYQPLEFADQDFQKRKRVKNIVPLFERCCAFRANGEQCTRRKKKDNTFCGTHLKGTPHGTVTQIPEKAKFTKKTVWVEDIKGIIYYVDNENNVYEPHDILENKTNPRIIAKYVCEDGNYSIPSLFKK
mgnify:CR=1 FL=1|tara:strand:- start:1405 stop:1923 length:519 start_codon:yes stop_codon:yes gene_type:complete